MLVRCVWPLSVATTRGCVASSARTAIGQRLVGGDDHPSVARLAQLLRQPAGVDRATLGVEDEQPDLRAEVAGVLQPVPGARHARGVAQPRDDLLARQQPPRAVPGDGDAGPRQPARDDAVDRGGVRRVGPDLAQRLLGVDVAQREAAGRGVVQRRGRGRDARDEPVVVAEHRQPRDAGARRGERPLGGGEQPRMQWRVDVGPVVERVRVVRLLHARVAGRAGVRIHAPAPHHGERLVELVGLRVVDEVTGLDDLSRALGPQAAQRAGEDLRRERLLGAERGRVGAAEAVEERRAGRGLLVADVRVGHDPEARELGPAVTARGRVEVPAVHERLAGRPLEHAGARRVAPRRAHRRAALPGRRGRVAAAAEQRDHREGEQARERASHPPRSPSTIDPRSARRATSSAASRQRAMSPAATISAWPMLARGTRSA